MYQRQATLMEAVKSALKDNYCNFSGRASRSQFWWFFLFQQVITFAMTFVFYFFYFIFIIGMAASDEPGGFLLFILFFMLGILGLIGLALFLPSAGVAVRRLHDTGRSGWWFLIGFVPIAGYVLYYFWALDSQPFPNQWGDVPMLVHNDYDGYDNSSRDGGYKNNSYNNNGGYNNGGYNNGGYNNGGYNNGGYNNGGYNNGGYKY